MAWHFVAAVGSVEARPSALMHSKSARMVRPNPRIRTCAARNDIHLTDQLIKWSPQR
ncbi:hypothetical protein EJ03DRAFT_326393 [Teratosphaeria nubilosa]|uniref:Uncharacterized protein n=1 Tax=Teratosphaeria nubilosa TaxID=161662 RepID=A0A6G1LC40_9PEZI|nr:hypothetical protein EJ03DRAFT_326393 [Teratosphaeria nubilosa]